MRWTRATPLPRIASFTALLLASAMCMSGGLACRRERSDPAPGSARLVVFAASSLRDVFTELGGEFRRQSPGVELVFNFAGTQELRTQLEHGAAADVFAAADRRHMQALADRGGVERPVVFARNEPVLIVSREAAAAARVPDFWSLAEAERIALGATEVPIGRYTNELLARAQSVRGGAFRNRVEAKVVSRELNVRQVLTKVRLGEAEAGIVYRTDARGVTDVTQVEIPPEVNVLAEYPIAVVRHAASPALAQAFVDVVRSREGREALERAGFTLPPDEVR